MQAEHSSKAYRLSERDFGVSTVVGAGVPLSSLTLYVAFTISDSV